MRNPKRYFTFLYVPAGNTGLKTIRIPKWLSFTVLAVLVALVAVSTGAVLQYMLKAGETYQVIRLTEENEVLRAQLDALSGDVARLEGQVRQNFDFQKKARLLANLDDLAEDIETLSGRST